MRSGLGWELPFERADSLELKEKMLVKLTKKAMGKTWREMKSERMMREALEMREWKRVFERSNNMLP